MRIPVRAKKDYLIILAALILFIFIFLAVGGLYKPRGRLITDWTLTAVDIEKDPFDVTLPAIYLPDESGVWEYTTELSAGSNRIDSLFIPRINGYAFKVILNDQLIHELGDFDFPTANIWNYSHLIELPADQIKAVNSLTIRVYALHDIGFIFPPSVGEMNDFRQIRALQNLYSFRLSLLLVGATFFLGCLLFILALKTSFSQRAYIYISLACVLFSIYSTDTIFRDFTGSLETFLTLRKFMLCSYIGSVFFIIKGLAIYLFERKIPLWVNILTGLSVIPLLAARSFVQLNNFLAVYNIIVLSIAVILLILFYISTNRKLLFCISFFTLSIAHTTFIYAFHRFSISYLMLGISFLLFGIMWHLIKDFNTIQLSNTSLKNRVIRDSLTGAFNRVFWQSLVLSENDYILFCDFDYFKKYNDTFGHQFGDALLCDFAVTAEQIVRKGDAVIRFGGDEFIIVFFSATYETCCRTAEKLREYIRKKYDFVDISYGICPFRNSAEETLKDADEMMYSMKKDRKR